MKYLIIISLLLSSLFCSAQFDFIEQKPTQKAVLIAAGDSVFFQDNGIIITPYRYEV